MLILVTGGSRSGKSSFALELAAARPAPRLFLATARALDDEMKERVRVHQAARGPGWELVEEPVEVPAALRAARLRAQTIVIDCVTLWLSNLLLARDSFEETDAGAHARELLAAAAGDAAVVVVTNEVGSGIVPENALARRFRDCAGRANQVLAAGADEAYLLVSGLPIRLKPPRGRDG